MKPKRILIFNVNWLGDVIFSTAVIRNIRRNYPQSFIACIVPARCYPILKNNPNLDEIIIFDEKDRHKCILAKLLFIKSLKRKKFDIVFLLHRSLSRALICFLAGIPERIGHYTKKRGWLLTKKIIPPAENSLHRLDYYMDVIEKAGLRVEDRYAEFFYSDDDMKFSEDFLKKNSVAAADFLVTLNPGGNWMPKRWPKEYWAVLADRLIAEFGAKVIFTGASSDLDLVSSITEQMLYKPISQRAMVWPHLAKAINSCGAFSLKHLGALARRSDLFITADSGPLHIAVASGATKIIALFGPTDPLVTAPFPLTNVILLQKDVGCKIPCYALNCSDNRCMKAIMPDEVIERVRLLKIK